jgi:hypothetical protein
MSRFRGTLWPGVPLPEPAVEQLLPELEGNEIVYRRCDTGRMATELPVELVTRELLMVDPRDPGAVLAFLETYGPIRTRADRYRWSRPRVGLDDLDLEQAADAAEAWDPYASSLARNEVIDSIPVVAAGRLLGEVRWCASWLVGLVGHDVEQHAFQRFMNRGLMHFAPRVIDDDDCSDFRLVDRTTGDAWEISMVDDFDRGGHDLIDCLYGQLANLVLDGGSFRTCPICDSSFVRQRGRARQGQYRVAAGVTYCSVSCSNTASSRAYRARKRQAATS